MPVERIFDEVLDQVKHTQLTVIRHPREKIRYLFFNPPCSIRFKHVGQGLNLNAMVQVDISQLTGVCNEWREKLRYFREEFSNDEAKLRQVAGQTLSKEQLQQVEHLHNQFHIQLINIHDLKQSIKAHERKMNFEKVAFNGSVNEDSFTRHEHLSEEFQSLDHTLQELRTEFGDFLEAVK